MAFSGSGRSTGELAGLVTENLLGGWSVAAYGFVDNLLGDCGL